jgi:hypothetical protein
MLPVKGGAVRSVRIVADYRHALSPPPVR